MTTFATFVPLSLFPILIVAILLVAVIVALCRKDNVRTAIWMKSYGFFLEANNNPRKPEDALPDAVHRDSP
jgi:hypothetical protein